MTATTTSMPTKMRTAGATTAALTTTNPACSRSVSELSIDPSTMPARHATRLRAVGHDVVRPVARVADGLVPECRARTRPGCPCRGQTPPCAATVSFGTAELLEGRALTRVAAADNEHELPDLARTATSYQLEQICCDWRRLQQSHDLDRAARQCQKAGFTWHWGDDGRFVVHTAPSSSIPRAVRRALRRRDKARCQFPGCTAEVGVDAHQFASPDGRNIPRVPSQLPGVPTGDLAPDSTVAPAIDATTLQTGLGERLDLELTVWALCNNHPVGGRQPRQPRCAHGSSQQG